MDGPSETVTSYTQHLVIHSVILHSALVKRLMCVFDVVLHRPT